MRKYAVIAIVVSVVSMVFVGFDPSSAQGPGGDPIGVYYQLGSNNNLTTSHTSWADDALEVEGPLLTSKLEVQTEFLDQELGVWGSLQQFTVGEEVVEFDTREASFVNLSLGPEPVFTWGANDQIEFLERPMWISTEQAEFGKRINLSIEDGNSSGQEIYISKDWLWERGIHRPNVTHEDGTVLQVNQTDNNDGFTVDVHHFSKISIDPVDLEVKGRQNGLIFPHTEETRWNKTEDRLEVDVEEKISEYDVLVEKDWLDVNIPNATVMNYYIRDVETVDGKDYYTIYLDAHETPTTILLEAALRVGNFQLNMTEFQTNIDAGESVTLSVGRYGDMDFSPVGDPIPREFVITSKDGQNTTLSVNEIQLIPADGRPGSGLAFYDGEQLWGNTCVAISDETGYLSSFSIYWPGEIPNEIQVRDRRSLTSCDDEFQGSSYPHDPPAPPVTRNIHHQGYLEESFFDQFDGSTWHIRFSNAAQHVSQAVSSGQHMWADYTGNYITIVGAKDVEDLFIDDEGREVTDCGKYLKLFKDYVDASGDRELNPTANDYYALISGHADMACTGAAQWADSGELANPPDIIALGMDREQSFDTYYGFSFSDHLGTLIGQEVGHVWGEPVHPCQTVDGKYSVMADSGSCQAPWDDRHWWIHYYSPFKPPGAPDTRQKIIDGTMGYD